MGNKQIFDDFPEVDCNVCECYYTNQCDGTPTGSEKPCKTFKAVRRVDIPLQIKAIQNSLKWLWLACLITSGLTLGCLGVVFTYLIGG